MRGTLCGTPLTLRHVRHVVSIFDIMRFMFECTLDK